MKKINSRSGSALLIVLGMLTFLIVSAVGFATYMRYGRLPSSQLRRTVSGRQLVKAAMARAIDEIDQAINNNPHPNVGTLSVNGRNRNIWYGRVFTGTNITDSADGGGSNSQNKDGSGAASYSETVSPLCLEALAYIPPVLINEARYYSRMTPTARWRTFDFEAGRYAFMALDVSDYFDINRLFADRKRSSAPNQRISLSYLFEQYSRDNDHNGLGEGADKWDEFMNDFRTVKEDTGEISFENTYPLISLADLNLAIGDKDVGGFTSPFCSYLKNPDGNGFYNLNEGGRGQADAMIKRMTFVTDGLFPKTERKIGSSNGANGNAQNSDGVIYDVTDAKTQPFDPKELSKPKQDSGVLAATLDLNNISGEAAAEWKRYLGDLGCLTLYDYLDADRVPLSVALPTVEQTPMICGVQTIFGENPFKIKREPERLDVPDEELDVVATNDDGTRRVKKEIRYLIDDGFFTGEWKVNALTVFPFARSDNDGSFKIDGRVSFFFSSEQMRLRTGRQIDNPGDMVHLYNKEIPESRMDSDRGVLSFRLTEKTINMSKSGNAVDQNEFVNAPSEFDYGKDMSKVFAQGGDGGPLLLRVTIEWMQKREKKGEVVTWTPSLAEVMKDKSYEVTEAATSFPALTRDGKMDEAFGKGKLKDTVKADKEVFFNCALWLRVKDDEDNVVDMVPACLMDDTIQNGAQLKGLGPAATKNPDGSFPLLKFKTDISFAFSIDSFEKMIEEGSEKGKLEGKTAIVADPRYNFAPEEWFYTTSGLSKESWMSQNQTRQGDRDRDIFMATSDAGYLQSIYEIAFLPRLTNLSKGNDSGESPNFKNGSSGYEQIDLFDSVEKTRNFNLAWRTYDPFRHDKQAFRDLPFVNEGSGFKVNPYSDSVNVLMSVFANTPIGWRQASTNKIEGAKVDYSAMDMEEFNKKYAFNAYSTDKSAVIPWEVLENVAENMIAAIKSSNQDGQSKDWEDVFLEDLGWDNTDENRFLGIETSDSSNVRLWGVDKKFLYGFWKDCFAVKQQLFLVFVRAEPTMLGSGASGHAPPQLGGKAVALVWRDPTPSRSGTGDSRRAAPHKTRVLFYRQFE